MTGLQTLRPACAVSNFSAIAGIGSPARVASALNGQRPFDNEDAPLYMNVLRRMQDLQNAASPLPLDWTEVGTIKEILAAVSAGTLTVSVHQDQPVLKPAPQFLVFLNNQNFYFVRRSKNELGQVVTSGSYQTIGATQVTLGCAEKIVEALKKLNHRASIVKSASIDPDGAVDDFSQVWHE